MLHQMRRWWIPILFISPVAVATTWFSDGKAKVFVGPQGETLTVVALKPRPENRALLLVSGTQSEIDDRPILHSVRAAGTSRTDYVTKRDGRDYVTVYLRDGQYGLSIPGKKDDVRLKYDAKKSEKADPNGILNQYMNRKLPTASFDEKAERTKEDKRVETLTAEMNSACGTQIPVVIDWSKFRAQVLQTMQVGEACGAVVIATENVCSDKVGKETIGAKVKSISCHLGDRLAVGISGGKLDWTTAQDTPDQVDFAKEQIESKL